MATTTQADGFMALLKSLRAVRRYADKPLPAEAARDIQEVIRWSGSASNRQEFQVLWVEDRAILRGLSELKGYAKHLAGAAAGAVIVSGITPSSAATTRMNSDELNAFDEGRIAERIMLAALVHGIGSSIGMFVGDGREQAAKLLGLPAGRTIRTAVSVGYPAEGALRGGRRRPLDEVVKRIG
jgi:nitroreductase